MIPKPERCEYCKSTRFEPDYTIWICKKCGAKYTAKYLNLLLISGGGGHHRRNTIKYADIQYHGERFHSGEW